ncbi:hypothetical protein V8C43DRAFT_267116 [Trichoderma afarasin]
MGVVFGVKVPRREWSVKRWLLRSATLVLVRVRGAAGKCTKYSLLRVPRVPQSGREPIGTCIRTRTVLYWNERVQSVAVYQQQASSCLVFLALSLFLHVSLACLLGTGPQWLKPARPSTLLTGWLAAR